MVELEDVVIDAPVAKVWASITEPVHIAKWFNEADHEVDEMKPGGLMKFHFGRHGTMYARILEVEPYRVFSYRVFADLEREPHDESAGTVLRYVLVDKGDKTLLRLEENNTTMHRIKRVAEST
ncbi:SRPBCC domain-containing protein [Spirillospora sp. NBC_00431]